MGERVSQIPRLCVQTYPNKGYSDSADLVAVPKATRKMTLSEGWLRLCSLEKELEIRLFRNYAEERQWKSTSSFSSEVLCIRTNKNNCPSQFTQIIEIT